jgi:hypothetical protein
MTQYERVARALVAADVDDAAAPAAFRAFARSHAALVAAVRSIAELPRALVPGDLEAPRRRARFGGKVVGDPPAPDAAAYYVLAWVAENDWAIVDSLSAIRETRDAVGLLDDVTPRTIRIRVHGLVAALERLKFELERIDTARWIGDD